MKKRLISFQGVRASNAFHCASRRQKVSHLREKTFFSLFGSAEALPIKILLFWNLPFFWDHLERMIITSSSFSYTRFWSFEKVLLMEQQKKWWRSNKRGKFSWKIHHGSNPWVTFKSSQLLCWNNSCIQLIIVLDTLRNWILPQTIFLINSSIRI